MFINKSCGDERERQIDKQNPQFDKHNSLVEQHITLQWKMKPDDAAIIVKIRFISYTIR